MTVSKHVLKPKRLRFQRLKLEYHKLLSTAAFKLNLRHFPKGANSRYEVEVVDGAIGSGEMAGAAAGGAGAAAAVAAAGGAGGGVATGDAGTPAEGDVLRVEPATGKLADGQDVRLRIASIGAEGEGGCGAVAEVRANCTVYFCREDDICLLQRVRFEVPIVPIVPGGAGGAEGTVTAAALRFNVPGDATDNPVPSASASAIPSLDAL